MPWHRAGDGGNKARLTRESAKETVKTNRAGKAGLFRRTCGDYARVLLLFRTRGCGCVSSIRLSLRPPTSTRAMLLLNPGVLRRGNECAYSIASFARLARDRNLRVRWVSFGRP